MEWTLATLAVVFLAFAAISGRIDGTPITAPMFFTAAGLVFGVDALGLVDPSPNGETVKLLAEATLTLVLFADASRIDLRALRGELAVPARLLGIGLPLTLGAGFLAALAVLGSLDWPEALVLAIILAPTDAALGQAVVTLPRLPSRIRQGLNVESGLNDGICVPIFFVALAVAQAEEGAIGNGAAAHLVAEELGYGILGGAIAGVAAAGVVILAGRRGFIEGSWLQIIPLAGAGLAYGIANPLGGSGFIAAFVGGLVFGALRQRPEAEVEYLIEEGGAILSGLTFIVFGATLLEPALDKVTVSVVLYAVLSLTVVRMVPVAIAMLGTGARRPTVGFLGWFGPRGLASIVFAIIVLEEGGLPHDTTILETVYITIGLSVFAHGLSAAPLANRYARWYEAHPRETPLPLEGEPVHEVRWRRGFGTGSARGVLHKAGPRPLGGSLE
ncbi:MAG TPA: cation:proton antiporter [Candidatus Binatia bacterium]|nr:cation:proton antiporter [Candidatus Binatia bacterium]